MPPSVSGMYSHFSRLASEYNEIRATDSEPVHFIREVINGCPGIRAVDIGCGAGRYDLLLFRHLNNLHLTCIDINVSMLEETARYLKNGGIENFLTIRAAADDIPLKNNSMDCIVSFNALHHFHFTKFLQNVARITRKDAFIFLYTRLRSQNEQNIWGQHFPFFKEKEKRLFELDEMTSMIRMIGSVTLESVRNFRFRRKAGFKTLADRVKSRHYSTFSLYTEEELSEAFKNFEDTMKTNFNDHGLIEWFDENIMLVLRTV